MATPARTIIIRPDGVVNSEVSRVEFYAAENLIWTVKISEGNIPLAMPAGAYAKLTAWVDGTEETLYIEKSGTALTSSSDELTVELTPAEANLAAGSYLFQIQVYGSDDTLMRVAASGKLTVRHSPVAEDVTYVGTSPAYPQSLPDLDDVADTVTPTAGKLLVGNGTAWTTLSIGSSGNVLTVSGGTAAWSAPTGVSDGDKGDIVVTSSGAQWTIDAAAVTLAKMADLSDSGKLIGRHTAGAGVPQEIHIDGGLELSGANLRRSALTGDVTASAGSNTTTISNGAVTNAKLANMAEATVKGSEVGSGGGPPTDLSASDLGNILATLSDLPLNSTAIQALSVSGAGSGLTNLTAGNLSGDIPAASFGEVVIDFSGRDMVLTTTAEVGWTGYEVDNATRTFSADAVSSANTSAQSFVLRTMPKRVPRGFVAFKTTGALVIEWIADSTTVADITGIELIGYSDITGAKTTLYTDSTTRNVGTINVPTAVSINRSAFSSTTVPTHLLIEVSGQIEDSAKLAILHMDVSSE